VYLFPCKQIIIVECHYIIGGIRRMLDRLLTRPATCKVCGLTARNKEELEDHVNHAHKRQ
jgi:hypothetical protein